MKRYNEIAPEVLAGMTQAEIDTLIELEVAHSGIEPVPEPAAPPAPFKLEPKVVGYKVGDLVFATADEAQHVARMATLSEETNYSISYEHKFLKPHVYNVETVRYFTEQDILTNASQLRERKAKEKESETGRAQYTAYQSQLSDIRSRVTLALNNAYDFKRKLDLARATWERFVKLADGDMVIAEKFYMDAYKNKQEMAKRAIDFKAEILYAAKKKKPAQPGEAC